MSENIGLISYSLSCISYLIFAVLLLVSWRGRFEGGLLIVAIIFQFVWSLTLALNLSNKIGPQWIFFSEIVRDSVWLLFFYHLLPLQTQSRKKIIHNSVYGILILLNVMGMYVAFAPTEHMLINNKEFLHSIIILFLILSLVILVVIEQLYRNIIPEKRWRVKYLCIAVGVMFLSDLYMYADAALFGMADIDLWVMRGFVNVLVVPIWAMSVKRYQKFSIDIFVSRQVVFYSTGILSAGLYLTLVALAGAYIKAIGSEWSSVAQLIFFLVAAGFMMVLLMSKKMKAKSKVFIVKHFYKNRYDYREEWLRLIHNLSDYVSYEQFNEKVIQSMAIILQSRGGVLYLEEEQILKPVTYWAVENTLNPISSGSSLSVFLNKKDWIVDVNEYVSNPEVYIDLKLDQEFIELDDVWLIIPLKHHYQLIGFIILLKSSILRTLTWEDRDLLKAVSRQISSYLAFIKITEELNQAQQFNAFNRLSAFIVHDLKNQILQLDLIVKNAAKFRNNKEFIDDTFLTVENVVGRMQRLLSQLKQVNQGSAEIRKVEVEKILMGAVSACSLEPPIPEFKATDIKLKVVINAEKFEDILINLIQNAQDAAGKDGSVWVELDSQSDNLIIQVKDNGAGMDRNFIENKLFKPFYTTKGNAGMGIGAFEAREFIKQNGGSLDVDSTPGQGSTFKIILPGVFEDK